MLPPVQVHRLAPCEDLGNAARGDGYDNPLIIKTLQDRNPQTPAIFSERITHIRKALIINYL